MAHPYPHCPHPQHLPGRSRFGHYMGVVGSSAAREAQLSPNRGGRPALIVCAWCESNRLAHGAARHAGSSEWCAVSHDFVRDAKRDGRTSHGICPVCRSLVLEEWGLA
jgi:hypothetical protein